LRLLPVVEIGAVAARVGQRARLGDRAQEGRDPAVVAADLEDLLDDRAILALQVAGRAVHRRWIRLLVDLDEQPSVRHRLGGAGDAAVEAMQREGAPSAGQPDLLADLGDGADRGKLPLVAGDQQNTLFVAGVDGQRERHAREDDDVVQRYEKEATHQNFTFASGLRSISAIISRCRRRSTPISVLVTKIIRVA